MRQAAALRAQCGSLYRLLDRGQVSGVGTGDNKAEHVLTDALDFALRCAKGNDHAAHAIAAEPFGQRGARPHRPLAFAGLLNFGAQEGCDGFRRVTADVPPEIEQVSIVVVHVHAGHFVTERPLGDGSQRPLELGIDATHVIFSRRSHQQKILYTI